MNRTRGARGAVATLALVLAGAIHGCGAHQGGASGSRSDAQQPPAADSVTVGLWRFNETAGAGNGDSGPFRLDGTAGIDARSDFGRFSGGRRFQRSLQSFVFVPANPVIQPQDLFTCETWINPSAFGQYELTPIAACWSEEPGYQSWMFALGGELLRPPIARLASPGFFAPLVTGPIPGKLVFALMPEDAGAGRLFVSARPVRLDRWTHVAITFDGRIIKFYLDGLLDSQYAYVGRIRQSPAPLVIGNYLQVNYLTGFGGYLRAEQSDQNPYYAFVGALDELRISNAARTEFPKIAR
jgi:hypothetical protein